MNSHEQERRSSTIRITGLPLTAKEKKSRNTSDLKLRVFDIILGPILSVAYNNGLLDARLTVENTIVSCYRVGAAAALAHCRQAAELQGQDQHSEVQEVGHLRPHPCGEGAGLQVLRHCGGPNPACIQEVEGAQESRGH